MAAVLVAGYFFARAVLAGAGVLITSCWHGCTERDPLQVLLFAVTAFGLIAGAGAASVFCARAGWRQLGLFLVAAVAMAQLIEFTIERL